jgi:hypothetical protein
MLLLIAQTPCVPRIIGICAGNDSTLRIKFTAPAFLVFRILAMHACDSLPISAKRVPIAIREISHSPWAFEE